MALFHNLRLLKRMKKPKYSEPAIGWNDEDFQVGLVKYGIAEYAAPTSKKIMAPTRPEIAFVPADAAPLMHEPPELP